MRGGEHASGSSRKRRERETLPRSDGHNRVPRRIRPPERGGVDPRSLLWAGAEQASAGDSMSDEEEHLSREELVEREHQARLRDYEELQRLIEERCREAEARWRS